MAALEVEHRTARVSATRLPAVAASALHYDPIIETSRGSADYWMSRVLQCQQMRLYLAPIRLAARSLDCRPFRSARQSPRGDWA
ncbi:putative NAD/FAD-binding protein [Nocardia kruczakiae]|uniref:NAD/FAD-binding protein n=1 Tax=Nocardia kruczakiae TaxID=261477 RepID=A0ABU1XR81_9NOCA|nr:putative NAD/FAD-binding protein [Nocardia kruczakiae]